MIVPMNYGVQRWNELNPPHPAMLRLRLTLENYDVFQWCDNPGIVYGPHMHDEDQTHWILSGTLEITVQQAGTFTLNAGDRDHLPARAYHSARVVGDEPVMYLVGIKRREV
jgi:quercetin dioxygenase-like cupin family protein